MCDSSNISNTLKKHASTGKLSETGQLEQRGPLPQTSTFLRRARSRSRFFLRRGINHRSSLAQSHHLKNLLQVPSSRKRPGTLERGKYDTVQVTTCRGFSTKERSHAFGVIIVRRMHKGAGKNVDRLKLLCRVHQRGSRLVLLPASSGTAAAAGCVAAREPMLTCERCLWPHAH